MPLSRPHRSPTQASAGADPGGLRRRRFAVRVAYGTSQRITTLLRGEFAILRDRNPAAYQAAGLSYDTKFDLRRAVDLPFTTAWFSVPPAAPHGQTPKLGTLHPSLVHAEQAALRAATT